MAKRGRKRTSTEVLKLRGSWVAQARKRERPRALGESQRATLRRRRAAGLKKLLDPFEVISAGLIPEWDPFAQAEDCKFDVDLAAKVLRFFVEKLTHTKGRLFAGRPIVPEPWQQAIIANLFGWIRPDGLRRFREAFIEVARGNGKTTIVAGLALYLLLEDEEPGAEIYALASEFKQAALLYEPARLMVEVEPSLQANLRAYKTFKSLEYNPGIGDLRVFRALSADAKSKHGFSAHGALVDEVHAHPNRDLIDVIKTSMGKRDQPLIVYITTSDYERISVCNELEDYAVRVRLNHGSKRKPGYDPAFLPAVWKVPKDKEKEWRKPKTWSYANPSLGACVSLEFLKRECRIAQENPAYENFFKRMYCNIRTQSAVAWLPMDRWDECAGRFRYRTHAERLKGELCFAGLDLSKTRDLTAFVLFFPEQLSFLSWFWIPKETALEQEKRDRVPYTAWADAGFIELTEGDTVDYPFVRDRIFQIGRDYAIEEILYDPWNASQFAQELAAEGVEVTEYRQGWHSLNEPSKELERLVFARELRHGGHPVLDWNAGNVSIETDATGSIKPSKKKSTHRIDGIVAAIMAIGGLVLRGKTQSVYETRGIRTL